MLAAGALLDAFANAQQLVTPRVTYIGTLSLAVLTVLIHWSMRLWGVPWQHTSGTVRLIGLGPSQICFVVGVVALLWYPRAKDFYDIMSEPKPGNIVGPSVQFKKLE